LTSGRISSEIVIKVAKRKIPIIASRAAPTDLAVRLAEKTKLSIIGFARGKRMNIYTHNFRIK
jgi:FdhD protein